MFEFKLTNLSQSKIAKGLIKIFEWKVGKTDVVKVDHIRNKCLELEMTSIVIGIEVNVWDTILSNNTPLVQNRIPFRIFKFVILSSINRNSSTILRTFL